MVTQEMVNAVMQERNADIARLLREFEALKREERGAPPRDVPSGSRFRWISIPSFVVQRLRAISPS